MAKMPGKGGFEKLGPEGDSKVTTVQPTIIQATIVHARDPASDLASGDIGAYLGDGVVLRQKTSQCCAILCCQVTNKPRGFHSDLATRAAPWPTLSPRLPPNYLPTMMLRPSPHASFVRIDSTAKTLTCNVQPLCAAARTSTGSLRPPPTTHHPPPATHHSRTSTGSLRPGPPRSILSVCRAASARQRRSRARSR